MDDPLTPKRRREALADARRTGQTLTQVLQAARNLLEDLNRNQSMGSLGMVSAEVPAEVEALVAMLASLAHECQIAQEILSLAANLRAALAVSDRQELSGAVDGGRIRIVVRRGDLIDG